jgi:hypothetical protein
MSRAMNYSIVAGGSGALFLTVCNNQPIFNVYMLNYLGVSPELLGLLLGFMQLSGVLQLVSIIAYSLLPRRKASGWRATSSTASRGSRSPPPPPSSPRERAGRRPPSSSRPR